MRMDFLQSGGKCRRVAIQLHMLTTNKMNKIVLPLASIFVFVTLATGAAPMAKYSAMANNIGLVTFANYVATFGGSVNEKKAVTIKNMARLLQTNSSAGSMMDHKTKEMVSNATTEEYEPSPRPIAGILRSDNKV